MHFQVLFIICMYLNELGNLQHHDLPDSLSGQTADLFRQFLHLFLSEPLRVVQLQVGWTDRERRDGDGRYCIYN